MKPPSTPSDDGSGHTTRCLPTRDLENAFNQIDWSCFLWEIRRVAPGLARCCDLCYSNGSFVVVDPEKIPSKRGVQQGESLQAHSSSPLASTGPSQKDEHRMKAATTPWATEALN